MLGTVEPLEDVDHAVAVRSVVDAVLVLDHHDVERVEGGGGVDGRLGLVMHHVMDDGGTHERHRVARAPGRRRSRGRPSRPRSEVPR